MSGAAVGAFQVSDDRLLRACQRLPVDRTPVWFMRQAGRYLPEYRAIRRHRSILEICHDPELAAEVTVQPVHRLGVDAAIVFADILLPFEPLGLGLSFHPGEGPVIERPIRSARDIERLPTLDVPGDLGHVLETIRRTRRELADRIPVIGFAGAPFTLASYAIEGGASRQFIETKRVMYNQPEAWHRLLDRFATLIGRYLSEQVKAGARAIQLFDSWVGCLSPADYRQYVAPHSRRAIAIAREQGAPLIHFGTGTATLLDDMTAAGGDVISIDWRIPLDAAWNSFPDKAIQGNLDPAALLGPLAELGTKVDRVLEAAAGRPGHIFNLGHGMLPQAQPERARTVVEMVADWCARHREPHAPHGPTTTTR